MPGQSVTVRKLDAEGRFVIAYEGVVGEWLPDGVRVDAVWTRPPLPLGYTTFEPGDRFIEWYYTDRWYSFIEIHSGETGTLKGWYCNVATPATIETSPTGEVTISYRDLYLDLWVAPDGTTLTLDEDEFADAPLDVEMRERAHAGMAALLALIERRDPPFQRMA
ncbi:MAG TPA: DUF402 domain-containing protein [Ktedonobacterales bacterium]|nr:DUF402 domain-containing protein [Ktedonobacterales bacterium]